MKDFLKKLNKRLNFLSEKERKKIITKYHKKIETEVKNGAKVKDVIKSFGTIEDIIKDICKEYNLDYEYCSNTSNLDKNITNISHLIGDFIRSVMKVVLKTTKSYSLQSFLEVLVKIIFLVFVFILLKLPVVSIEFLIQQVNYSLFYPYTDTFNYALNLFMSLIYIVMCVTSAIKVFGTYKINDKEEVDSKVVEAVDKDYDWIDVIIRFVIYIFILVPLCIVALTFLAAFLFSLYMVLTGINLVGLPALFIGLLLLIVSIIELIKDSLSNKNRTGLFSVIGSLLITFLGVTLLGMNLTKFNRSDDLTKSELKLKTDSVTLTLEGDKTYLYLANGQYEIEIDERLSDNEIETIVTYYDDYVDIFYDQYEKNDKHILSFKSKPDKDINYVTIINNIVKDLRNNNVFNYSKTKNYKVIIKANSKTKERLSDY